MLQHVAFSSAFQVEPVGKRFHCYAARRDPGREILWAHVMQRSRFLFVVFICCRSSGSTMQDDGGSSTSQLFCNHKIDDLHFLTGLLNILSPPLGYVCVFISDMSGIFLIKH